MVATGVGVLAILLIGQLLVFMQSQFETLQKKVRLEVEVSQMAFFLQHYASMAINLTAVNAIAADEAFNSTYGRILNRYDLSDWVAGNGDGAVNTLAYFLRETLSSRAGIRNNAPANNVRYLATGIFFQRPTIDRYGVLYINSDNVAGGGPLRPRGGGRDELFGGIVNLVVRDVFTQPYTPPGFGAPVQMVYSFSVEVTQRHYVPGTPHNAQTWCPPDFMNTPECAFGARGYRDVTKSFTVRVKNNVLAQSTLQRDRVMDNPMIDPTGNYPLFLPRYRRSYDNIYFLRPVYPPEALTR